ncbi:MAG: hypothetical protein QGD92_07350 [Gammaproteobacteria bacterium]|nr:hypothetical protein [Gammaproteobacteria bacterium]
MMQLIKIVVFSLLTIGFFTAYSYYGIPQIIPAPPPEKEELDLEGITTADLIVLGERIFKGKGACTLCHNDVGGRAPMLDDIGMKAQENMADSRYKGTASSVEEYLYESLVDPSAYVVAGFGKMGTQDSESPMTDVRTGSIKLSEEELLVVVAYLQDLSGLDVTVEIPVGSTGTEESGQPAATTTQVVTTNTRAKYDSAEEILSQLACGVCHIVGHYQGLIGPDLSHIGGSRSKDYLRRAILDPNAELTEGYMPMMPPTYGDQLYASELEMLVEYMSRLQ